MSFLEELKSIRHRRRDNLITPSIFLFLCSSIYKINTLNLKINPEVSKLNERFLNPYPFLNQSYHQQKKLLLAIWGVLCKYKYMYVHYIHVCAIFYLFFSILLFDFMRFSINVSTYGTSSFIFISFMGIYKLYLLYIIS